MSAWSHVKYLSCGTVSNVPTSHFKDVIEKTLEPSELEVNKTYLVFWSSTQTDSPKNIISQGNKIVNVDALTQKERERLVKANNGVPLKGYYFALLLDLRSAEDSMETVDRVSMPSSKRTRIPTEKVQHLSQKKTDTQKGSKDTKKSSVKKVDKLAVEEASRSNSMSLLESCAAKKTTKVKPSKKVNNKPSALPQSNSSQSISKAADITEPHSSKSQDDNIDCVNEPTMDSKSAEMDSAEYWKLKYEEMKKEMSRSKPSSTGGTKESATEEGSNDCIDDTRSSDGEDDPSYNPYIKQNPYLCGDDDDEEADEKRKICYIKKRKVKPGKHGDSLFVFNMAAELWKPEVLAIRTPTGLPKMRGKGDQDQKPGYPKLTPSKKKKIEEALKKRVASEIPTVSEDEREERLGRLNYHLSQKISSVRRSLRDKGKKIPSAEAVKKAKEKGSDETAAYEEANEDADP